MIGRLSFLCRSLITSMALFFNIAENHLLYSNRVSLIGIAWLCCLRSSQRFFLIRIFHNYDTCKSMLWGLCLSQGLLNNPLIGNCCPSCPGSCCAWPFLFAIYSQHIPVLLQLLILFSLSLFRECRFFIL